MLVSIVISMTTMSQDSHAQVKSGTLNFSELEKIIISINDSSELNSFLTKKGFRFDSTLKEKGEKFYIFLSEQFSNKCSPDEEISIKNKACSFLLEGFKYVSFQTPCNHLYQEMIVELKLKKFKPVSVENRPDTESNSEGKIVSYRSVLYPGYIFDVHTETIKKEDFAWTSYFFSFRQFN